MPSGRSSAAAWSVATRSRSSIPTRATSRSGRPTASLAGSCDTPSSADARGLENRLAGRLLARSGLDAGEGTFPVRVDRGTKLVEVDQQRRVVRRDGRALARLAIDLGVDDPLLDRLRDEQVVDAHPEVLMEVASPVVPPREPSRLVVAQPVTVGEPEPLERPEGSALGLGHVGPPVDGPRVPDVAIRGRHIEIAAEHDRVRRLEVVADPASEPFEPRELAGVERRADDAAVRRVQADDAQ